MDYAMQSQALVRSLKGAPLSVLTLMLWCRMTHDPVWSVEELVAGTAYKREAIAEARNVLISLGLCDAGERGRIGLRLRDLSICQLGLFDLALPPGDVVDAPQSEIGKTDLTLASSSSSFSSYIEGTFSASKATTTTDGVRSEKPISLPAPRHPAAEELTDWMVKIIRCPSRRIAGEAVDAALDAGEEPIDIKMEALWWWVYCANGNIRTVPRERWGFFIARKIQNAEYVYEGYTYSEHTVKAVDEDLYHEFLEVKHLYDTRHETTENNRE